MLLASQGVAPNPRLVNGRGLGIELVPSQMYRLELRSQAGNYRWIVRETQARFLGVRATPSYRDGSLDFNLRPAGLTMEVPVHQITRVTHVSDGAPFAPRPIAPPVVDDEDLDRRGSSPDLHRLLARLRAER